MFQGGAKYNAFLKKFNFSGGITRKRLSSKQLNCGKTRLAR
jgi:hypothetical protein